MYLIIFTTIFKYQDATLYIGYICVWCLNHLRQFSIISRLSLGFHSQI